MFVKENGDNMLIKIINGSVSFLNHTVLESVNFTLNIHDKVAIVGRNGCGKSTFLNALINNEMFDVGVDEGDLKIEKRKNISIGYLEQVAVKNEENTLEEELLLVFKDLLELESKLKYLEINMSDYEAYEQMELLYKQSGGYTYKGEIDKLLQRFGFSLSDKLKKIGDFSGGEKTKIAFIKLLLSKPDILILDEPTNQMDLDTIVWLEEYLVNYPKAMVLVSHDRMFLDHVVTQVYEIEYGSMEFYKGNYSFYEKQKKEVYLKTLKDYEFQQKEIKRLQSIADRFRYKPSKAGMAMAKLSQIERMVKIDKPQAKDERRIKLFFPLSCESGDVVLSLKNLNFGYDFSLGNVSFTLHKRERLAILGNNGCGKSTLLKTIMGYIPKLSGSIEFGYHVTVAYFDQEMKFLLPSHTILSEMKEVMPSKSEEEIRRFMGRFLFTSDDIFKKIEVLSGGEKVRLSLAKILAKGANLLILDEPTNHLDIIGRQTLEECLKCYEGTILFVSHDRYFIDKIADSFLILDDESYYFRGSLKDYQRCKNDRVISHVEPGRKRKEKKHDILKDIKKIEKEIQDLEILLKETSEKMFLEEYYMDYEKMAALKKEHDDVSLKLEEKMELWQKLMSDNLS